MIYPDQTASKILNEFHFHVITQKGGGGAYFSHTENIILRTEAVFPLRSVSAFRSENQWGSGLGGTIKMPFYR